MANLSNISLPPLSIKPLAVNISLPDIINPLAGKCIPFNLKHKNGQFGRFIALAISLLYSQLQDIILTEVTKILDKWKNGLCPDFTELRILIKKRNKLRKDLNTVIEKTQKYIAWVSAARVVLEIIKIIAALLCFIHIPSFFSTVSIINKITQSHKNALDYIDDFLDDLEASIKVIKQATALIDLVFNYLSLIDGLLYDCINSQQLTQDQLKELADLSGGNIFSDEFLASKLQTGTDADIASILNEKLEPTNIKYQGKNGKIYYLSVIRVNNPNDPIPQRQAIAKDDLGVVVLQGEKSYSATTSILLQEIKFRIDNSLP